MLENPKETATTIMRISVLLLITFCFFTKVQADELDMRTAKIPYPRSVDVFVRGENNIFLHRIPALAVTTTGTILALCDARIDEGDDLPNNIDLALRRSFDLGKTWAPIRIIADFPGTEGAGDASLLVDKDTGRIWAFYVYGPEGIGSRQSQPGLDGPTTLQLHLIHSDDDGATWSKATNLNPMVKDPAWKAAWPSPGSGFQARSGRLYFPLSQVSDAGYSRMIYSDDHGETWEITPPMGRNTNESMCVELDDGRLMANMRGAVKHRTVTISSDQGQTWKPMTNAETLIGPQCQASLIRYSSLSNGDDRNRLLFCNPASTKRENMTVRLSYDEGKTWPVSKVIYPGKSGYSSLAVLPDGSVGLFYEHGPQHDTDQLSFVRFTIEWLTDGQDKGVLLSTDQQ
jgi:sialidase-1